MDGRMFGPRTDVDTTSFYKLLEVKRNASEADIKKAFKRLAVRHHPDKGGDPETFKDITRAYEVLGDASKREKYNRGGEEAVDGRAPSDTFESFFRGRGRRGTGCRTRQKTKEVVMPLKVTLEELYTGVKKQMAVTRKVIDRQSGVQTCSGCNGRGVKVDVGRMGPVQQMQSTCGLCGGHGKSFKTQVERELVDVHVQRGSPDRHRVVVREKADEHPDGDTGDVVFVLEEQEHAVFKRRSADLFIERSISFVEALCGFEMGITHLDGRKLLVKTSPGEIVKPLVRGFDPYVSCESKMEWEVYEDRGPR